MSLFERIHADMISAMKEKRKEDKDVLTSLYGLCKNKEIELKTLKDEDVLQIVRKFTKQLDEEIDCYTKANRTETVERLVKQKSLVESYLPKQLSETEIREIIGKLEDKSIPSVMKYFKANYSGLVDMSIVSKIARG